MKTRFLVPPKYDLPEAVINAASLRGELMPFGPSFIGPGWPDSHAARAACFSQPKEHDLSVILLSAAWVWGVCDWQAGQLKEYSTQGGRRFLNPMPADSVVREFKISGTECVSFAGVTVSSPLRTLYDLLFLEEKEYCERVRKSIVKLLLDDPPLIGKLIASIKGSRRPYLNRALMRLSTLI